MIVRRGRLTRAARNKLLASMTNEVGEIVLHNNYLQSQALSVLEQRAPERLTEYQSLIRCARTRRAPESRDRIPAGRR